jgi:Domain of unknown function (DUF4416)
LGKVREPEPAILFIGMLYSDPAILHQGEQTLKEEFGNPLMESPASKWDYSPYYRDELGWPLSRKFIFFKNVIDPETLADIKVRTNEIEESFSINNKRLINLDPGYLTLSKIVLASTKNYAHRIYLKKGIYGEITLYFEDGIFKPHLFTYRDFQAKHCLDIFMQARSLFKKQLDEKAT